MAQASFYIEPSYNSGERVAGGFLTIYTDNTVQSLVPLWKYADLKADENGGGSIANPVPIDGNGVNSSPIFYDPLEYPSAYYILRDARQATIRQGFILPQSWQIAGQPEDPTNPFDAWPAGDLYWGYEVVQANQLSSRGNIGRPLFLSVNNGDPSGGLILYFRPGASGADNILSFQGNNGIWAARSEWINYSYLETALASRYGAGNHEPFAFLQANYPGQYNINLNKVPLALTNKSFTTNFKGKIKISAQAAGVSRTNAFIITVNVANANDIQASAEAPVFAYNGNSHNIMFNVKNGAFNSSGICAAMGNGSWSNFIQGTLEALTIDADNNYALHDLDIGNLNSPDRLFNPNTFAGVNVRIRQTNAASFVPGIALTASSLNSYNFDKLVQDDPGNFTINLDEDIHFFVESMLGSGYFQLTNPDSLSWWEEAVKNKTNRYKGFRIEISPNAYACDNTFYAKNVEFYSTANLRTYFGSGSALIFDSNLPANSNDLNNVIGHSCIFLGSDAEGTMVFSNSMMASAFYCWSEKVNIVNIADSPFSIYGHRFGEVKNMIVDAAWYLFPGETYALNDPNGSSDVVLLPNWTPHDFSAQMNLMNMWSYRYVFHRLKANKLDGCQIRVNSDASSEFGNITKSNTVLLIEDTEISGGALAQIFGSLKIKNSKIRNASFVRIPYDIGSGHSFISLDTGADVQGCDMGDVPLSIFYGCIGMPPNPNVPEIAMNRPGLISSQHPSMREYVVKGLRFNNNINVYPLFGGYNNISDYISSVITFAGGEKYIHAERGYYYVYMNNGAGYSIENINVCKFVDCEMLFNKFTYSDSASLEPLTNSKSGAHKPLLGSIKMHGNRLFGAPGGDAFKSLTTGDDVINGDKCVFFFGEAPAYMGVEQGIIFRPNLVYRGNVLNAALFANWWSSVAMIEENIYWDDSFLVNKYGSNKQSLLDDLRNAANYNVISNPITFSIASPQTRLSIYIGDFSTPSGLLLALPAFSCFDNGSVSCTPNTGTGTQTKLAWLQDNVPGLNLALPFNTVGFRNADDSINFNCLIINTQAPAVPSSDASALKIVYFKILDGLVHNYWSNMNKAICSTITADYNIQPTHRFKKIMDA